MLRFVTEARSATGAWAAKLAARPHPNVAAVALANKQARIAWAVLTRNRVYEAQPGIRAGCLGRGLRAQRRVMDKRSTGVSRNPMEGKAASLAA
jgi:hypothetical protein